ncbi:hypothetical protein HCN51_46525 [Nonomuraea sp. FMUSA5-5]|uniref:BatC protein n=1 Tax=Nonomuraea composti TaxID=2720023 RepID=A0ABX1BGD9_9ACTN|nr:hypothetical protein [Nonomuraea sp. FMUSA5-5]NJP96805.1 hypothetical protein [Nonomuraea sp. FMUSA5-5]
MSASGVEGFDDLAGHVGHGGAGLVAGGGVEGDGDGAAEVAGLGGILLLDSTGEEEGGRAPS